MGPRSSIPWIIITSITYLGDDGYVTHASLPADAETDQHSGPDDIGKLIDYLKNVDDPPCGNYSCDMDHSNACGLPDILRVTDLLNGTSKFICWNTNTLPTSTCPWAVTGWYAKPFSKGASPVTARSMTVPVAHSRRERHRYMDHRQAGCRTEQ